MRVVIDPGHGGFDSGATGNGLLEKNINLNVALKVYELLLHNKLDVIMTRNIDKSLELSERVAISNNNKCNIFVSIHHNAGSDKAFGYEVIYSVNNTKSKTLADCIGKQFELTGQNKHGVGIYSRPSTSNPNNDYYGVLRGNNAISVITEYGYISSTDYQRFDTMQEQIQEAYAIAKGICCFANIEFKDPAIVIPSAKEHWAEKYYQNITKRGIMISEKKYDQPITRGEVFALIDKILDYLKR